RQVVAHRRAQLAELDRHRQADVSEADDANGRQGLRGGVELVRQDGGLVVVVEKGGLGHVRLRGKSLGKWGFWDGPFLGCSLKTRPDPPLPEGLGLRSYKLAGGRPTPAGPLPERLPVALV